ncbi:MAG: hypothetical protein SPJ34_09080 [Candidatus Ornithospirochaeta sp.]|nr:hypothetical protein [Candidatus Ornithospirochaeta sp.]
MKRIFLIALIALSLFQAFPSDFSIDADFDYSMLFLSDKLASSFKVPYSEDISSVTLLGPELAVRFLPIRTMGITASYSLSIPVGFACKDTSTSSYFSYRFDHIHLAGLGLALDFPIGDSGLYTDVMVKYGYGRIAQENSGNSKLDVAFSTFHQVLMGVDFGYYVRNERLDFRIGADYSYDFMSASSIIKLAVGGGYHFAL